MVVIWPLGYALFWGSYLTAFVWDGALFLGPYYYLPLVPAVSIAAAVGLSDLFAMRRRVGVLAAVAMAVLSLAVIAPALDDQLSRSSQRVELADRLDREIDGPALVFLPPVYGPYLMNPFSFLRNTPPLDGEVVYALQRDAAADERVRAQYPDRTAYRVTLPRNWSDQPGFEPVIVITRLDDEATTPSDQS
jgi:membrane protein implicated in regulation of membrane protease activity